MKWTQKDIPDQSGKTVIVTGANTGLGFQDARALATKGAKVIMACRNEEKGKAALQRILDEKPSGSAEISKLDLSSLDSIREFAARFKADNDRLDLQINNAGVMMPPFGTTADGFELQFGTNHLGHFALTGLLIDLLLKTEGSRVVNVSSMAHRYGKMDFDDLQWINRPYKKVQSYGQSKLANLMFTFELQRRLEAKGATTLTAVAHPGWTATDLQRHSGLFDFLNPVLAMKPEQGALPTLYAATAPEVKGGDYFGPGGFQEMRGYPKRVGTSKAAQDIADAGRLWRISEELTGVAYLSA